VLASGASWGKAAAAHLEGGRAAGRPTGGPGVAEGAFFRGRGWWDGRVVNKLGRDEPQGRYRSRSRRSASLGAKSFERLRTWGRDVGANTARKTDVKDQSADLQRLERQQHTARWRSAAVVRPQR